MMVFETHGFMQDEKWYEDLGHVALGLLPLDLLLYAREWTTARLPWPFRGQWPPGDIHQTDAISGRRRVILDWAPLDRVEDVGRDTLGYDIGRTLRFVVLASLLAWRW